MNLLHGDYAEVYDGVFVEITDLDAFGHHNPLASNPLIALKYDDDDILTDAHRWSPDDWHSWALPDVCIRCDGYGYGPLCARHLAELREVTP